MTVPVLVPCTFPEPFSILSVNPAFTLLNVLNFALTASRSFFASGSLATLTFGACANEFKANTIRMKDKPCLMIIKLVL